MTSSGQTVNGFNASDFISRYFDCWNRGAVDDIVNFFAAGGVYTDPSITGEVGIDMMRAYLGSLRRAFPNLKWEPLNEPIYAPDRRIVVCEWRMTGTQSGELCGKYVGAPFNLPATGRTGVATGVDVINLDDAMRITRHATFFDQQTVYQSLGFNVLVHPKEIEGAMLGLAAYLPGADQPDGGPPSAYSLTWIEPRDAQDGEQIVGATQLIMADTRTRPGFMGWVAAVLENRMFTITAWRSADDARQAAQSDTHRFMADRFAEGKLGRAQHAAIAENIQRGRLLVFDDQTKVCRPITEADSPRPAWW